MVATNTVINRIYLYGYRRASKSLRNLQQKFKERGFKCIRRGAISAEVPRPNDLVLVWGTSVIPNWAPKHYINTPDSIAIASDKLKTFQTLKEANVPIPEFTTNIEDAKSWLPQAWVVCRKLLRASGGRGIQLAKEVGQLVQAPLYVKYKRKQKEFRVHVWKGTIIDVQEKRRRTSQFEEGNTYIRNHANGWVFCRNDILEPINLRNVALSACAALKLDFGAVDIIYNEKYDKLYVLEVNTAPGLEGTTLTNYVKAIVE